MSPGRTSLQIRSAQILRHSQPCKAPDRLPVLRHPTTCYQGASYGSALLLRTLGGSRWLT